MRTKRSKYGNIPHVIDGIRFASKKEANRYAELKILKKAGKICNLNLQIKYEMKVNGLHPFGIYRHVCDYIGDFEYYDIEKKEWITEDVKGTRTPVYRLKAKLFEAIYGRKIVEI